MTGELRVYRRSELEVIKPAIDADGCLLRWKTLYADGVDDTSDPALIGIAFHAINYAYVQALMEARLGQDFEMAEEAFKEGVAAAQTPSRLLPEIHDLWKWHAESFELPVERFVTAEEHGASGNVGFTPDLVLAHPERNSLEIIDFKSGWSPPISEEELKRLWQARVYTSYGAERWPHFGHYEFTLVAVRFRKRITVSFTPDELDAVQQEVDAAIVTIQEAIRLDSYPATPGPACRFCTIACPVADTEVMLPKRLDVQQYHKLGSWLLVAEKQLKMAKKLMKAACAIYGPAVVNGMEYNNRATVSRSYPLDAVLEALKARGAMGAFEDPSFTISHSALAKVFKQYPKLEEDLKPFVNEKPSYRFSAKALSPNPDAPMIEGDDD